MGLKLILGTQPETLLSSDVALSVSPIDVTNFQEMLFTISDPNNVQVLELSPVLLFTFNHSIDSWIKLAFFTHIPLENLS